MSIEFLFHITRHFGEVVVLIYRNDYVIISECDIFAPYVYKYSINLEEKQE